MKLRNIVSRLEIDPRKLTEYALNPDNPVGKDKAIVFQSRLGFTKDNYNSLLEQISNQALDIEVTLGHNNEHGQRYTVDILVVGIEAQEETVRTGWIVQIGSDVARLVTLYVRKH